MGAALACAFQVAIEAGAADAQQLRRAHAVAAARFEDLLDVLAAHFVEREGAPRFACGAVAGRPLYVPLQIVHVDKIAGS